MHHNRLSYRFRVRRLRLPGTSAVTATSCIASCVMNRNCVNMHVNDVKPRELG